MTELLLDPGFKVAHLRLCHSRVLFVRACRRETQEMVFDAHGRAVVIFKGARTRVILHNLKSAVDTIFVGRELVAMFRKDLTSSVPGTDLLRHRAGSASLPRANPRGVVKCDLLSDGLRKQGLVDGFA